MAVSTHQTNTDPLSPRRYACETRVVSGLGVISLIPDELRTYGITNPALVVDAGIVNAGLLEKWLPETITTLPARILCPVNPNVDAVQAGIDAAKSHACDGVVIIGGGSTICLGKAIAIMLRNPGHILNYEGSDKLKDVRCRHWFVRVVRETDLETASCSYHLRANNRRLRLRSLTCASPRA